MVRGHGGPWTVLSDQHLHLALGLAACGAEQLDVVFFGEQGRQQLDCTQVRVTSRKQLQNSRKSFAQTRCLHSKVSLGIRHAEFMHAVLVHVRIAVAELQVPRLDLGQSYEQRSFNLPTAAEDASELSHQLAVVEAAYDAELLAKIEGRRLHRNLYNTPI
jgi:hypothetical protein